MKRRAFLAATAATAATTARAAAQIVPAQPINSLNNQFLPQLTIAVNVTLSGPLAKYGNEVVKGVQAAVDEQNRFHAPIGNVWGLKPLDDRNDQGLAASNANVAAADSTVIGVVGNLTAAMTLAALSRYANMGFALIVPTVTADAVTGRGYHNVYRLPAKDSTAGRLFAGSALDGKRGVSTVAVAFDGDYGYDVARGFVDEARNGRHSSELLLFPPQRQDRRTGAGRASASLGRIHRRFRCIGRFLQQRHDLDVRDDARRRIRRFADAAARPRCKRRAARHGFSA
jgi:ABC-type branched-subunit amino acid transport system substrate-binding protein